MTQPVKKHLYPLPSRTIPLDVGVIHFIGIGGIGMSGIAEILHNLGYSVSGSDIAENANVNRLRAMGIEVHIGHKEQNIDHASVVVMSTAVPLSNVEILAARKLGIPVVRRAEMLAELTRLKATIAVAGTHGKTTTTSIISTLLQQCGMDPTIINGGIINSMGTNAVLGKGDWLVVEADESDGTFIKIPATIGVVTNIEPEHLDYYGTFDAARGAFEEFIQRLPFYGVAILCHDHPEVKKLIDKVQDRRIITYGLESGAQVTASNIRVQADGSRFDAEIADMGAGKKTLISDIFLPMPGRHNIQNSLSAVAVAHVLGIAPEALKKAFGAFGGVKRRFTKTGEVRGITIIDDYGHHPTEIAATLATARSVQGKDKRVIAVMQPHRFTRLKHLFDEFSACFHDADMVIVSDVYTAGETPIDGANRDALVEALRARNVDARPLENAAALPGLIKQLGKKGDMVVCLGAGSISQWANALPADLEKLA